MAIVVERIVPLYEPPVIYKVVENSPAEYRTSYGSKYAAVRETYSNSSSTKSILGTLARRSLIAFWPQKARRLCTSDRDLSPSDLHGASVLCSMQENLGYHTLSYRPPVFCGRHGWLRRGHSLGESRRSRFLPVANGERRATISNVQVSNDGRQRRGAQGKVRRSQ